MVTKVVSDLLGTRHSAEKNRILQYFYAHHTTSYVVSWLQNLGIESENSRAFSQVLFRFLYFELFFCYLRE